MATEGKTEPKTEQKPEASKEVVVEENAEPPLKYKQLVLKVSVHCEGCRRKVKKILTNIEGVYTTEIDLRQQKVTVLGNVGADTLIKKLEKAGKHAELWPEKADHKGKKKGKSKNKGKEKDKEKEKDKQSDQESGEEGGEKDQKETVKTEVQIIQDPSKTTENGTTKNFESTNVGKASEGGAASKTGGAQVKEVKFEVKPVAIPAVSQSPVIDKKGGSENESGAEKSGTGGKKKKKKGHKGNNNNGDEGEHSGDAPAGTGSPSQGHGQGPFGSVPYSANHSLPHYPVYQYPPHYYAPSIMYAVNHSTAYPTTSYGASINPPSYSHLYMHPGTASEPLPLDFESNPSQPLESFEIFSDENPNACSIM